MVDHDLAGHRRPRRRVAPPAEHGALDLAALDALLDEHLGVVDLGVLDRALEVGEVVDPGDAERGAGPGRLDEDRQPQLRDPREHVGAPLRPLPRRDDDVRPDRQAGAAKTSFM